MQKRTSRVATEKNKRKTRYLRATEVRTVWHKASTRRPFPMSRSYFVIHQTSTQLFPRFMMGSLYAASPEKGPHRSLVNNRTPRVHDTKARAGPTDLNTMAQALLSQKHKRRCWALIKSCPRWTMKQEIARFVIFCSILRRWWGWNLVQGWLKRCQVNVSRADRCKCDGKIHTGISIFHSASMTHDAQVKQL